MENCIRIKGACEHNLKNIDLEIPRDKLVVITGLSGSGKSSLAFDTIYAEGQRRYMESLSSYARQFLGLMEKPDVESIEGLSPAISIDQKTTSRNPRSTVGTVTEIYDYFRLMFARIGVPHCPECGREIAQQTVDQMVDAVMVLEQGTRIQVLAPVVRGRKGEYTKLIQDARKKGFVRVRIDGEVMEIQDDIRLDKNKKHTIEIVVDRLIIREDIQKRLTDSIESALNLAGGLLVIDVIGKEEMLFSQNYACPDCGISIPELTPRMFSFNNPYGACPECSGLGVLFKMDPDLIIPDKTKSLAEGAVTAAGFNFSSEDAYGRMYLDAMARHYGFSVDTPVKDLPEDILDKILYGTRGEKIKVEYNKEYGSGTFMSSFEGIINSLERRYRETKSNGMKEYYESFMSQTPCPVCQGKRLKKESLAVTVGGKNIHEICLMSVRECMAFFHNLELKPRDAAIAAQILKEIRARLKFLMDVGLDYLTLSRAAGTLSGGEAQRIRLATQIGSGLMGVLYILDEPSIGLHQRDNERLLATLKRLRDLGNTLLVVEHDEDTMYAADHIIDMGPGAGEQGGRVVAQGTVEDIKKNPNSITGKYLSGAIRIEVPEKRREYNGKVIRILGARENNLKDIDVDIPLGVFTCVTGVSGSGKSTLVNEILYKKLAGKLNHAKTKAGLHRDMLGLEHLDKVINIDQSPIGRTPRSNPATYTGVFDLIRSLFAETTDAKMKGYSAGRFSFNVRGGRCEACAGDGIIKIEMHFLPDVYVPCEVCKGRRYNRETLDVKYKGKNIADVLDMTVDEALKFFENIPRIQKKLQTLHEVGLGYIRLGQPATTLSGGEAQRVKLATELSRKATGRTMYILDEPTTGLHMADVHKLIEVLHRLVDAGNTVVVIEHNLDVIKTADHIIDLGPEGGDRGGQIVACGRPEEVAQVKESYTGQFLKKLLPGC
ncbi:MAG TPA: excinuclease ABC subunit UvrA [Thermoclostridium caenicola]|mgnify:FL=1|uniref:excinuclease ABC subunit UvrA n=1 Tax=Thermoclostridium caenicola TaxID=659425 RepID=UPI002CC977AD|nr:excinuclease ABC subunit UvrA [Thermoclostridium caenicola]HOL84927.1 excinuclease ABC subunit UvrA [Thermoclostridium caenicola]HPO77055.1 excinuclease ABC subunit UvrA [Thermoclostridium caenicola]